MSAASTPITPEAAAAFNAANAAFREGRFEAARDAAARGGPPPPDLGLAPVPQARGPPPIPPQPPPPPPRPPLQVAPRGGTGVVGGGAGATPPGPRPATAGQGRRVPWT